jgi:hypothetical protein
MAEEPHPESGRVESELERADRNLTDLLGELRLALPGVQVLFAFLLVVPFNQGFDHVTEFQRKLYLGILLCAALASAFLIAPTVHHRLMFRRQDKDYLVTVANRQAVVGLTFLAIAMTGAVVLVTDFLFAPGTTVAVGALVLLAFVLLWYALPLRRRASLRR